MESAPPPRRALVIVAHCDDIEFVCAGTIARWIREGWQIVYVICTDSSKGTEDPDMSPQKLVQIRQEEQRRAAAVLGVEEVVFLGREDGALVDDMELRRDLVRLIRQWKPLRVVAGDPTFRYSPDGYINHPDHVAAASAAAVAVYPFARNRPTFPDLLAEGLEPWKVAEMYFWSGGPSANWWIDISDYIDLKIQALREHRSQLGDWDPDEMVREWARSSGAGQLMDYAESYRRLVIDG